MCDLVQFVDIYVIIYYELFYHNANLKQNWAEKIIKFHIVEAETSLINGLHGFDLDEKCCCWSVYSLTDWLINK